MCSLNDYVNRSRSVSSGNIRNNSSTRARTRTPSPSRRSIKTSQSYDFEHRGRSQSLPRRSSPQRLYHDHGKSSLFFSK